jgi:tetratricopeptide (TPR) repeat protein
MTFPTCSGNHEKNNFPRDFILTFSTSQTTLQSFNIVHGDDHPLIRTGVTMKTYSSMMRQTRVILQISLIVVLMILITGCPQNYYERGKLLMDKGQVDEAINELLKALEKEPTNGEIYYRLGLLYLKKEE